MTVKPTQEGTLGNLARGHLRLGSPGLGLDTQEVREQATGDVMSGASLKAAVGTMDRKQT